MTQIQGWLNDVLAIAMGWMSSASAYFSNLVAQHPYMALAIAVALCCFVFLTFVALFVAKVVGVFFKALWVIAKAAFNFAWWALYCLVWKPLKYLLLEIVWPLARWWFYDLSVLIYQRLKKWNLLVAYIFAVLSPMYSIGFVIWVLTELFPSTTVELRDMLVSVQLVLLAVAVVLGMCLGISVIFSAQKRNP